MAKLYTKKGDKGQTSLVSPRKSKFGKHELIFEVIGEKDTLSAQIGYLCTSENLSTRETYSLRLIQGKLFDLGSLFATRDANRQTKLPKLTKEDVQFLEKEIDFYTQNTPTLREFILEGVESEDAYCHICRTTCRKLERLLWKMRRNILQNMNDKTSEFYCDYFPPSDVFLSEQPFIYVNRLSDFFFALARFLSRGTEIKRSEITKMLKEIKNADEGVPEEIDEPE